MKIRIRKKIRIAAILAAIAVCCISLCACNPDPPASEPRKTEYTLTYTVESGGTIYGATVQTVEEGGDGTLVTASADNGYRFVKWSDGLEVNSRTDTNITESKTYTAVFEKIILTLGYSAANGGRIEGETEQSVAYGGDCTTVRAIAEEGYDFKNWSDGNPYAERTDKSVRTNKNVTAYFEEYTRTFELDYKFGEVSEGEDKPETVTLTYANLKEYEFPVPTRDYFTFGGWYMGETCLTDINGKATASEDIIRLKEQQIHAKWTANETFTYNILLVYVTRIDAVLPTCDQTDTIHVDYTMSGVEREFFTVFTIRLKEYLDNWFDGLVDFQVNGYFTTQTVVSENFVRSIGKYKISNDLFPNYIPEVKDLAATYDGALAIFSLNDMEHNLHNSSGCAGVKYGDVNIETILWGMRGAGFTFEQTLGMLKNKECMEDIDEICFATLLHEFAHTIELRVNLYELHQTIAKFYVPPYDNIMRIYQMYLLGEAMVDGEKVGVPYAFWKGDIAAVMLRTSSQDMGSIAMRDHLGCIFNSDDGSCSYEVLFGSEVTLKASPLISPDKEFRFVRWSDGVTTPERTEIITGDLDLTAIFEEVTE